MLLGVSLMPRFGIGDHTCVKSSISFIQRTAMVCSPYDPEGLKLATLAKIFSHPRPAKLAKLAKRLWFFRLQRNRHPIWQTPVS